MTNNYGDGANGDAVMFGAGNVGRGFLGQLFSESGYRVVFVDIDGPLIARMRLQGHYTIRLVDNTRTEEVQVGPVTGLPEPRNRGDCRGAGGSSYRSDRRRRTGPDLHRTDHRGWYPAPSGAEGY